MAKSTSETNMTVDTRVTLVPVWSSFTLTQREGMGIGSTLLFTGTTRRLTVQLDKNGSALAV